MQRRNAALSLVAVVALGGVTGCEKQSPWVTVTAGGVVVKARAAKYCEKPDACITSTRKPVLEIKQGDILGIDVPKAVAEAGWRAFGDEPFSHLSYRAVPIPQLTAGEEFPLTVTQDPAHGEATWEFTLRVK